ncbi:MAG: DUF1217 domain-containing protein [Salipiger marinus]|uniref:DUF1217 domain-containing protein n=1 Tax=Salipiger marinus TaxID=555512 RepID=UPI0040592973
MVFAPSVLGTGLAGYSFLSRTRETQQALLAKSPVIARETTQFVEKLQEVQSSADLMADRSLLKVALGAFGLEDDLDNRAFISKILDSDLGDSRSLANRLADKRYLALAHAFNFAGDGAELPQARSGEDVLDQLAKIKQADDLLSDTALLRATLTSFGLEADMRNTYFLKQVLESDVSNPDSFANRLPDPRYAQLAQAFDLAGKTASEGTIYGYAEEFSGLAAKVTDVDTLFAEDDLLRDTLDMFGLGNDIYRTQFLRDVLTSNLSDPESVARSQSDPRYAALAGVFDFAARAAAEDAGEPFTSTLEKFTSVVAARAAPIAKPADLFSDIPLMLASFDFFDFPQTADRVPFANRVLSSDLSDPTSLANVHPDPRVKVFAQAFTFPETDPRRSYPAGFAEQIVENYLDRQFEIQVGEADPTLRLALSLDRELSTVVANGRTNDSRWFSVMASTPLREVFETMFGFPDSFGALDIDQQLVKLKQRAERVFGTDQLADLASSDKLEEMRRLYLTRSAVAANPLNSSATIVLSLLG